MGDTSLEITDRPSNAMASLGVAILLLIQLMPASATASCNASTEFYLIFMQNVYATGKVKVNPKIYVTSGQTETAAFWISAPKQLSLLPSTHVTLTPGASHFIETSRDLKLVGTGVTEKVAYINATGPVTVFGLEMEDNSMDSYLALPHTLLGSLYYLVTYASADGTCESGSCEAAVVATADATLVTIAIPARSAGVDVTFESVTYVNGSVLQLTLDRFQVFQFQSTHDLTGVIVQSNQSVAVFSGNEKARVGISTQTDHLVEQLLPVAVWGTEFAASPSPGITIREHYRVLPAHNKVELRVEALNLTLGLEEAGVFQAFTLPAGVFSTFKASGAVSIHKFAPDLSTKIDPCMTTLVPRHLWRQDYIFKPPSTDYKLYVTVVIPAAHTDCLELNGAPVTTTWTYFDGGKMAGATLFLSTAATTSVTCTNTTFALDIYGQGSWETYCMPAGIKSPPPCIPEANSMSTVPMSAVSDLVMSTVDARDSTQSSYEPQTETLGVFTATSQSAIVSDVTTVTHDTYSASIADVTILSDNSQLTTLSDVTIATNTIYSTTFSDITAIADSTYSVLVSDVTTVTDFSSPSTASLAISDSPSASIPSESTTLAHTPTDVALIEEPSFATESLLDSLEFSESTVVIASGSFGTASSASLSPSATMTSQSSTAGFNSDMASSSPPTTPDSLSPSFTTRLSSQSMTSSLDVGTQPLSPLPSSTSSVTSMSTAPSASEVRPKRCSCRCQRRGASSAAVDKAALRDMVREISVNKSQLSAHIRAKQSAPDSRVTSRVMGAGGLIILIVSGLLFVASDVVRVLQWLHRHLARRSARKALEDRREARSRGEPEDSVM